MGFYQQISKYYDDIFPLSPAAEAFFLKRFAEGNAKRVLDAACGSGSYVRAFIDRGYDAYGIDLDPAMVNIARSKTSHERIVQGDMLKASELFSQGFDFILCIGNSLVHLQEENTILQALQSFHSLLNRGGMLALQIINYDRILGQGLEGLPTIESPEAGLTFERKYRYDEKSGLIHFDTVLKVPEGKYKNSITLYPLKASSLVSLLVRAGFSNTKLYGDFKESQWSPESYATIATASV